MIKQQTIAGRSATIAYLHADFSPADAGAYAFAKVIFDDGSDVVFLTNPDGGPADAESGAEALAFSRHRGKHRAPPPIAESEGNEESLAFSRHREKHRAPMAIPQPGDPEVEADDSDVETPEKLQLVAWAKAIIVLDKSEIMVRDLIERELAGTQYMPIARILVTTERLVKKIMVVRVGAIKTAFRLLRERLGDKDIAGMSLARWAHTLAKSDADTIRAAIVSGLGDGLDNIEIARKVVGSMGMNGVDGVTEFTRHKIAHVGRQAIKESRQRIAGA